MGLSLVQLLRLLHEEGATELEIEQAVADYQKRKESGASKLAKRGGSEIEFPASPQLGPGQRAVDYGEETPQQARERWMRQEMGDPQGVFAGGQTAGGIFGGGSVATEAYDPSAIRRSLEMEHAVRQARVTERTAQLLERVLDRLEGAKDPKNERLQEAASLRRLLGRRRRG